MTHTASRPRKRNTAQTPQHGATPHKRTARLCFSRTCAQCHSSSALSTPRNAKCTSAHRVTQHARGSPLWFFAFHQPPRPSTQELCVVSGSQKSAQEAPYFVTHTASRPRKRNTAQTPQHGATPHKRTARLCFSRTCAQCHSFIHSFIHSSDALSTYGTYSHCAPRVPARTVGQPSAFKMWCRTRCSPSSSVRSVSSSGACPWLP